MTNKCAWAWIACCSLAVVTGCAPGNITPAANASSGGKPAQIGNDVVQVVTTTYNAKTKSVDLYVGKAKQKGSDMDFSLENLINPTSTDGLINYAYSHFQNTEVRQVTVHPDSSSNRVTTKTVQVSSVLSSMNPNAPAETSGQMSAFTAASDNAMSLPPIGVKMDRKFKPVAGLFDSTAKKRKAVIDVARSLLGTPYIWGHNEDRGQYGFDGSNFTAYVYHHALGYHMTAISKAQYLYVGKRVPKSDMRPGDLLIFHNGTHVGIYAGNNRMIEEGGGLGRVGYLSIEAGSYWGKHLTDVKRMF